MFGKLEDTKGECNARLYIADDYGDNHVTMRCSLSPNHDGPHCEEFARGGGHLVKVTWEKDERDEIHVPQP